MSYQSFFYDQQIRRYIIQFIRMISNFQVEFGKGRNGATALQRVPVIYGDSSRQAASIIKQNSENIINATPAMAVYISGLTYDRQRVQDPTFVGKLNLRERYIDPTTGQYSTTQGDTLTVERLMPVPYTLTLKVDIWTSNTEQKLQVLEQLCTLFNPALEIQSTDNYIDWTSISYVLLNDVNFSSRTVPVGTNDNIDIATLTFTLPIFISAPALVKKLGVVQRIVASVFDANGDINNAIYDSENLLSRQYITPMQYGTILLNNSIRLVDYSEPVTDSFGEQIIKVVANAVTANTRIVLDNTDGIETGMVVSGLRITGNGTITSNTSSNIVIGANTAFVSSMIGSQIYSANQVLLGVVSNVSSNTSLTLTTVSAGNVTANGYTMFDSLTQGNCTVLSINGDTIVTSNVLTASVGEKIVFTALPSFIGNTTQWRNVINVYGNLQPGTSQIRFELDDETEVVGTIAYNPADGTQLIWTPDIDTLPSNTLVPINAIIDPYSSRPNKDLQNLANGTRYLLTNDYTSIANVSLAPTYNWLGADGTRLVANANDIIQYNGQHWFVSFDSETVTSIQYVTNMTTGIQYKWSPGEGWAKSYEGYYPAGKWQLVI